MNLMILTFRGGQTLGTKLMLIGLTLILTGLTAIGFSFISLLENVKGQFVSLSVLKLSALSITKSLL